MTPQEFRKDLEKQSHKTSQEIQLSKDLVRLETSLKFGNLKSGEKISESEQQAVFDRFLKDNRLFDRYNQLRSVTDGFFKNYVTILKSEKNALANEITELLADQKVTLKSRVKSPESIGNKIIADAYESVTNCAEMYNDLDLREKTKFFLNWTKEARDLIAFTVVTEDISQTLNALIAKTDPEDVKQERTAFGKIKFITSSDLNPHMPNVTIGHIQNALKKDKTTGYEVLDMKTKLQNGTNLPYFNLKMVFLDSFGEKQYFEIQVVNQQTYDTMNSSNTQVSHGDFKIKRYKEIYTHLKNEQI